MKEIKVGEKITLEVIETDKESCKGCFFDSKSLIAKHGVNTLVASKYVQTIKV